MQFKHFIKKTMYTKTFQTNENCNPYNAGINNVHLPHLRTFKFSIRLHKAVKYVPCINLY